MFNSTAKRHAEDIMGEIACPMFEFAMKSRKNVTGWSGEMQLFERRKRAGRL